jgi:CBS-domain-containing membrane protein
MTKVGEIMTRSVAVVQQDDSLQDAAQKMKTLNIGSLPVCDGDAMVGVVTDRDITVRGVAAGMVPQESRISDVMTAEVHWCSESDSVQQAMELMGEAQVRRLAVLDESRKIVGVVSLGDLATRQSAHTDATLREISEHAPTAP